MRCSRQAYGIFLVHYIFIIWLQYAVYDYAWPAFVKFAIVLGGTLGTKLGGHGAVAKHSDRGADDLRVRKWQGLRARDKNHLRALFFLLVTCLKFPGAPSRAGAAYPDRVIKLVVPFAPGGGTDVVARTLAQEMAKDLGASVIIENQPGAGPFSAPSWSRPARRMVHAVDGDVRQRRQSQPESQSCLMTRTRILRRSHCWRAPSISSWSIRRRR